MNAVSEKVTIFQKWSKGDAAASTSTEPWRVSYFLLCPWLQAVSYRSLFATYRAFEGSPIVFPFNTYLMTYVAFSNDKSLGT